MSSTDSADQEGEAGLSISATAPKGENTLALESDGNGAEPKRAQSRASRASRSLERRVSEKSREDRNREKAAMLNIDYEALREESRASAAQIYAKLVEDRVPFLRENAAICRSAAPPNA
jgi:hypothetical protein